VDSKKLDYCNKEENRKRDIGCEKDYKRRRLLREKITAQARVKDEITVNARVKDDDATAHAWVREEIWAHGQDEVIAHMRTKYHITAHAPL
jgi:hypothetical protein